MPDEVRARRELRQQRCDHMWVMDAHGDMSCPLCYALVPGSVNPLIPVAVILGLGFLAHAVARRRA